MGIFSKAKNCPICVACEQFVYGFYLISGDKFMCLQCADYKQALEEKSHQKKREEYFRNMGNEK